MPKIDLCNVAVFGALGLGLAACGAPDASEPDLQVLGNAHLEKPAEVFRIDVQIIERDLDRLVALSSASEKLDAIVAGIASLDGLTSYRVSSDAVEATVERPAGCELGQQRYYDQPPRPSDCSPIEVSAVLRFTVEGTPAEAAGQAVAFLTQAEAEMVSLREFDVADRAAAQLEVKQAALADAMSTARALAEQAGVAITRPSSIRYGAAQNFNRDIASAEERVVITASRMSAPPPAVSLDLSPPPVPFDASVAVIFPLEYDGD